MPVYRSHGPRDPVAGGSSSASHHLYSEELDPLKTFFSKGTLVTISPCKLMSISKFLGNWIFKVSLC